MEAKLNAEIEELTNEKEQLEKRMPKLYDTIINGSPRRSATADETLTKLKEEIKDILAEIQKKKTQIRTFKKKAKKPSQFFKLLRSIDLSKKVN